MAREMNKSAETYLNLFNTEDPQKQAAFEKLCKDYRVTYRGSNEDPVFYNNAKVSPDGEILIDATEYAEGEVQDEVPNEDKVFLYGNKNEMKKMTLDELLATQPEPTEAAFRSEPEPSLGPIDWLQHVLSFLFGEPEVILKHQRQMEVNHMKKLQNFAEKYNLSDELQIDMDLLDEEKAKEYVSHGTLENAGQQSNTVGQKSETNESRSKEEQDPLQKTAKERRENLNAKMAGDFFQKYCIKNKKMSMAVVMCVEMLQKDLPEGELRDDRNKAAEYILAAKKNKDTEALNELGKELNVYYNTLSSGNTTEKMITTVKNADQPGNPYHLCKMAYDQRKLGGVQNNKSKEPKRELGGAKKNLSESRQSGF